MTPGMKVLAWRTQLDPIEEASVDKIFRVVIIYKEGGGGGGGGGSKDIVIAVFQW